MIAIVAGSTGATGRWIVCELVNSEKFSKVIALTRSDIVDLAAAFPSADPVKMESKLVVHKLDFSTLRESQTFSPSLPAVPTVGFCAMGSAPYTEESDYTTPVAFGKAAKSMGVDAMYLVSARGAKAGSWFGYVDTIGRREDAFREMGFGRLGIFRPGFMDRQEKRRGKEFIGRLLPKSWTIDTRDIAKAMVKTASGTDKGVTVFLDSETKRIAKE